MPVRPATNDDAAVVAEIYNYYIGNSHATFEIEAIDSNEMLERMEDGWKAGYPVPRLR